MKKITKKEKKKIASVVLFLFGYALLSAPINEFVDKTFEGSLFVRFFGGIILLILGAYFFDLI